MANNNFLPFAPTDTGTNLLSQTDYAAASDRTNGNQPGVASSKLVNKALRQAAYISSQFAQFLSNQTGLDILDDATPAKLLAQIAATLQPLPTIATSYVSVGSGTHSLSYYFFLGSANATVGATYTNNGNTYTVSATIAAGSLLRMTGPGLPTLSGTLTKSSGTGDSSILFYAFRAPTSVRVRMAGGGGGAAGSGISGMGSGTSGATSSFGTLLAAGGGGGAAAGGGGAGGGAPTITSPAVGIGIAGAPGQTAQYSANTWAQGGSGGGNPLNPGGGGGQGATAGNNAVPGTGAGGGGGGNNAADRVPGSGGGAAAYVDARIANPATIGTFAWVVGGAGTGGSAGSSGYVGGNGGYGMIYVEENFQ